MTVSLPAAPAPGVRSGPSAEGRDIAGFGAVHLEVRDVARSAAFWHDVVGLAVRRQDSQSIELGTSDETIITLTPGAAAGFQQGHSGLYHLAIHPRSEQEFALMLLRFLRAGWQISPVDHILSKAIYLLDPDGITVEITLETPERFREYTTVGGRFRAVDTDGVFHSGVDPLDVPALLETLTDDDTTTRVPAGTRVGHMHLYVGDLDAAYAFYQGLGFTRALWAPHMGVGDLGAGGAFPHRIAVNTWQGAGAPQSPAGTARMLGYTVRFADDRLLDGALGALHAEITETEHGYLARDPSGNGLLLTHE